LDAVWQLLIQFPQSFQFNEQFLICLADALYECRFGTFLEDSEKSRKENCQPYAVSLWTWVNLPENINSFQNPLYKSKASEGVLWPRYNTRNIRLWENYWLRWDPDHKPIFLSSLFTDRVEISEGEEPPM